MTSSLHRRHLYNHSQQDCLTTRKCVYFRSRDKDGGKPFDPPYRPNAAHKLCGPIFYQTAVIVDWSFTLREDGIFRFCCVDLDVDPMTFTCELDPYASNQKWTFYVKGSQKLLSYHIQTDRQTDTHRPTSDRRHRNYYHATLRGCSSLIVQWLYTDQSQ